MIIFQTPAPQTFQQQLEGAFIVYGFPVLAAVASFIIWKLNALRSAQVTHNASANAKLNAIVAATPGAPEHLAAAPPAPDCPTPKV